MRPAQYRHEQAACAARQGQHGAFGQQLADDPGAAPAQGRPHRKFLPPGRAAREEHVRQVQARNEQHDRRHRHDDDRVAERSRVVLRRARDRQARKSRDQQLLALVLRREVPLHLRGQARKRGEGGRLRCPRLQPSDDHQGVVAPVGQRQGRVAQKVVGDDLPGAGRHPQLGRDHRRRPGKPLGRDADDREGPRVDGDRAAQHTLPRAPRPPVVVADDGHGSAAARPLLVGREAPALCHADAKRREVVGRDGGHQRAAGDVAFPHAGQDERERGDLTENAVAIADVQVVGVREVAKDAGGRVVAAVDADDLARPVAPGHRLEQERVHEAEDGGVRADPDGQHQHRREREARRLPHEAHGEAEIVKE